MDDLTQHASLINALLSRWDDVPQDDQEVNSAEELLEGHTVITSTSSRGGQDLNAQAYRIYRLLSAQSSSYAPQNDATTHVSMRDDLNDRAKMIHSLLGQLGDVMLQLESEGVEMGEQSSKTNDLFEEVRILKARLDVVDGEIPRLRATIQGLRNELDQKEIELKRKEAELNYERSLNWELRHRIRDVGEKAWRRVLKAESKGGGPKRNFDADDADGGMVSLEGSVFQRATVEEASDDSD